ncbi:MULTISPECIES: acyl-CoA dehydrogenase family protein [Pseudomonas]|uniref:acyl-CoA dehydrogenase family protein n=1 Tax=Pseudomonas TaxID=286 RepID=UPI001297A7B3|nr:MULTISPECIES: acyl-CoA dehydrogenase family protein [Pseudomonas]MQT42923.1 acyl-CoA dehydrogenase [Pseudomonas sp. FSL R10-0765]MQT50361.1 acyl-CoA dehydrogenase [Pseudomonas sp. FSL R10-2398]MQT99933.1 acyl-CoA dehydrogenase [Pseudomonas sp. FSL R10-2245]MQU14227.1 acyl-CoA dehydrogenase [Pseudomonas sp. FSL R10-2189]MQU39381.1 acyl-CoA dehydrogenase [Pseudomonas sp. FSL R10-2172]
MEFAFTEEHLMIRDSAGRFLAQASDSHAVRAAMMRPDGHDPDVWQRIGQELFWPALMVPERFGGMGLGFVELAILMEQSGRFLLGSPLFATACMATPALLMGNNEALQAQWLEAIASGNTRATLAFASVAGLEADSVQAVAEPQGDGWTVSGHYAQVIDGACADVLIIAARAPGSHGAQGIRLFALPGTAPGVIATPLPTMDQTRRLARIDLHQVQVNTAQQLCGPDQGWTVLRDTLLIAAIGLAAEQTGGAQQALDLTLAYIAERRQFKRTIASFQAIKHRCADMMLHVECARSAAYYAACVAQERLAADGDANVAKELELAAATAKIHASEVFFLCAAESIQLHGGVGFTWEYDPHLYFKRARASEQLLGNPALHRERIAGHLLGDSA